ncbi:MAG TPA: BMP family ABC transporter substrate-binding protein [Fimbriimonadaceae bacterium]|nr:BMP family ABC transporter substrate-binding protein [Fimbriimonadaceae bacterium]
MRSSLVLLLAVAALVGCSQTNSGTASSTGSGASGSGKGMTVGVVFDSGGVGDKSFNDSAKAGLDRAEKELGITPKTVASQSEKDYATNIEAMASAGSGLVVAVGFAQDKALKALAPKYPNTKFAIVDGTVDAPNVRCLKFNEEQGSFLAGYLAALVTKAKKLGFVGGMEIPLIKKFYAGYVAGAKTADPAIEVLPPKYTGSWDDQLKGKAEALELFGTGADIVYHAAGRAGLGVIKAAQEQDKYAIGVDSDQDAMAPGHVLTSVIKHVDESVFSTISDVKSDKFTPGTKVYDLASGGVSLSPMTYTKDKIGPDNLKKVDAVATDIKSGKIKVPTDLAELDTYLAALPKK